MNVSGRQRLAKLTKLAENMEGKRIQAMLQMLSRSHNLHLRNIVLIMNAVDFYMKDQSIVMTENIKKLDEFLFQFTGLFRNYLMSFSSLVDHILAMRNSLKDEQFKKDYDNELKKQQIKEKTVSL